MMKSEQFWTGNEPHECNMLQLSFYKAFWATNSELHRTTVHFRTPGLNLGLFQDSSQTIRNDSNYWDIDTEKITIIRETTLNALRFARKDSRKKGFSSPLIPPFQQVYFHSFKYILDPLTINFYCNFKQQFFPIKILNNQNFLILIWK